MTDDRHVAEQSIAEALASLGSSELGLTSAQAGHRLQEYGPNRLAEIEQQDEGRVEALLSLGKAIAKMREDTLMAASFLPLGHPDPSIASAATSPLEPAVARDENADASDAWPVREYTHPALAESET